MFQRDCLFDWKTIYKNILLGLEIQKNKTEEAIASVNRMLEEYNLMEFKNSYPHQVQYRHSSENKKASHRQNLRKGL